MTSTEGTTDTTAGDATTDQAGPGQGGTDQRTEAQDVGSLPAWAQQLIKDTRGEAAAKRTEANQLKQASQAQLDSIAKALGLKPADADPVKLAAELDKARTAARTTAVELAVYRTAGTKGIDADPAALLDSRGFMESVSDLDPQAADFGAKVETAIKDAVRANPKLKATAAGPSRSGPDGPPGGTTQGLSSDPRVADLQQIEADLRAGARRR
jgi:hypothetical protein